MVSNQKYTDIRFVTLMFLRYLDLYHGTINKYLNPILPGLLLMCRATVPVFKKFIRECTMLFFVW